MIQLGDSAEIFIRKSLGENTDYRGVDGKAQERQKREHQCKNAAGALESGCGLQRGDSPSSRAYA